MGATFGGTLVFDYGFNVETAGDSPVWHSRKSMCYRGRSEAADDLTRVADDIDDPFDPRPSVDLLAAHGRGRDLLIALGADLDAPGLTGRGARLAAGFGILDTTACSSSRHSRTTRATTSWYSLATSPSPPVRAPRAAVRRCRPCRLDSPRPHPRAVQLARIVDLFAGGYRSKSA